MDPKRVKVTLEQLGRLGTHLQKMINELRSATENSFTQQFQNIQSLAGGLGSAEFNLRAQQKVINAMALELLDVFQILNVLADDLNDVRYAGQEDAPQITTVSPQYLQTVELEDEGGEKATRISWGFYHEEVEKDKAEMERLHKEAEEKAKAALEQAKAEADEKRIQEDVEKVKQAAIDSGNDPEEVSAEAERLLRETKAVADETGKMMRGEPYDEEVIAEAQKKIAEAEEDDSDGFPEGASIFGG